MSEDRPLKSAYELAMERLSAKDKSEGVRPPARLTDKQKERIAAARHDAKAKLAELEILHRKDLLEVGADIEKVAELNRKHAINRERVESRLESAIEEIRSKKSSE